MEQKSPNTEIDLLEVLIKFFSLILQNKILIVACALAGLLSGFALVSRQKPTWEASLMVSTTLLSPQEGEFIMNEFIESGSVLALDGGDHVLNLSKTIRYDSGSKNIFLELNATTDSKNVFPGLQKGLINYVNKSEPVLRKIKNKKLYYSELVNKIALELESLEKTKNKLAGQSSVSAFNPSDLSVKSIELYEHQIQYQQALKDLDSVSFLVKGFEPVEVRKSNTSFLVLSTALGVILAAFIIILRLFIPYYKKFINAQG